MNIKQLAKPRFIIGLVALVVVAAMTITETIGSEVGIALIIGILSAFGAYHAQPPQNKD